MWIYRGVPKYETKMRRAGPLKEKFILRLLAPPPLPSLSPKLSYGCLPTAAAMPQTCQGSSCRSQSSPTSAPSTPMQAGFLAGTRRTGCGTPACCAYRHAHAGRVLPNPPLSQWPPAPSSRGIPLPSRCCRRLRPTLLSYRLPTRSQCRAVAAPPPPTTRNMEKFQRRSTFTSNLRPLTN